jgi:hypothetical protein
MHINYLCKNNETHHINMDTCIGRMAQHEKILQEDQLWIFANVHINIQYKNIIHYNMS